MRAEVPFLGHIVSYEGVGVDPAKMEAVEKWPTPVNVKDVRAFFGFGFLLQVIRTRLFNGGSPDDQSKVWT